MAQDKFVTLEAIAKELKLEIKYTPGPLSQINIYFNQIFRPGLAFAGFYDVFMPDRIQVAGLTEDLYLSSLDEKTRVERINTFFSKKPGVVGNESADGTFLLTVRELNSAFYTVHIDSFHSSSGKAASLLSTFISMPMRFITEVKCASSSGSLVFRVKVKIMSSP